MRTWIARLPQVEEGRPQEVPALEAWEVGDEGRERGLYLCYHVCVGVGVWYINKGVIFMFIMCVCVGVWVCVVVCIIQYIYIHTHT